MSEILYRGEDDTAVKAVAAADWLEVIDVPDIPKTIAERQLGSGEAALLAWGCSNPGLEIVIDDLAARKCARARGVPVRGTLSLVIEAKRQGHIPTATPGIRDILSAGLFISDRLLRQVLGSVGESL